MASRDGLPPVPAAHLEAIGQIVVNFGRLENAVGYLIPDIIPLGCEPAFIMFSELSLKQRCAVVSGLAKHYLHGTPVLDQLSSILKRVSEAEGRRNALIHSWWLPTPQPGYVASSKASSTLKRGFRQHVVEYSSAQLNRFADRLATLTSDVEVLGYALQDTPRPKKPRSGRDAFLIERSRDA